jgi:hypothetical protein
LTAYLNTVQTERPGTGERRLYIGALAVLGSLFLLAVLNALKHAP